MGLTLDTINSIITKLMKLPELMKLFFMTDKNASIWLWYDFFVFWIYNK